MRQAFDSHFTSNSAPAADRRHRGEQGASSVEYGLLAAFIAGVIVVAVMMFGGMVKGEFIDTNGSLCAGSAKGAAQSAACTSAG